MVNKEIVDEYMLVKEQKFKESLGVILFILGFLLGAFVTSVVFFRAIY
jgi:uncharacterized membrane protein YciS (DUF1049 family)